MELYTDEPGFHFFTRRFNLSWEPQGRESASATTSSTRRPSGSRHCGREMLGGVRPRAAPTRARTSRTASLRCISRHALLIAAIVATGCGADGARERSPVAGRAEPSADLRAPDRLGRLQVTGGANAFACATGGRLDVRFAGRDGVTVRAGRAPLAFVRARVRLVRRDCERVRAGATRSPAGGARGLVRPAVLRCAVPRAVVIELPPLGAAAVTRLLVIDPRTRRLVLSAVVEAERGRLFVARACRPAGGSRVAP